MHMKSLSAMNRGELEQLLVQLEGKFEEAKARGLKLDMSRGKPSPAQLDLVNGLLDALTSKDSMFSMNGMDCRNYGALEGIPEARHLMGDLMDVPAENVIVCGNSSLSIMHDCVARCMLQGVNDCTPWCKLDKVRFLCPAPGYDRHFKILEAFGIDMVTIPMTAQGPDMDLVEQYVNGDESVKGIWCVPKYSNPLGITFSDEVVRRFAALKPAAKDFRIFWDNAYCVHDLYGQDRDRLLEIFTECRKYGNEELVFEFASTSKVSMSGAGIAAVACFGRNLKWIKDSMTVQTIGYDKMNQLRHARYYKNKEGVQAQMVQHAQLIRPKFEATLKVFEEELGGLDIGTWTNPKGGYFISFDSMEGCAKAIVDKCGEAGVTLTGAGATYPYGKDPQDKNIRIAPTYPSLEEMQQAAQIFVLCVKIVSIRKLLADGGNEA